MFKSLFLVRVSKESSIIKLPNLKNFTSSTKTIKKENKKIKDDNINDKELDRIDNEHLITENIQKNAIEYLITASDPKFNHRIGQHYSKFNPEIHLFSSNWIKRGTIGKYFTINPIGNHPALSSDQNKTFIDIGLDINLAERLKQTSKEIEKPTKIQEITFNEIFPKPKAHLMLTAENGSGKTLAYILPILQNCIQFKNKLNLSRKGYLKRSSLQPICIILVPSRELAFQVYDVIAKLINNNGNLNEKSYARNDYYIIDDDEHFLSDEFFKYLKDINVFIDLNHEILKNKQLYSNKFIPKLSEIYENTLYDNYKNINNENLNNFESDSKKQIDILITTPNDLLKRIKKMKTSEKLSGKFLRHLVIDEADTLLNDSFNDILTTVIKKLYLNLNHTNEYLKNLRTQLIFSSAIVPNNIKNILKDIINCDGDEFKSLVTNRVNYVMTHISQKFIRTSVPERDKLLIELINSELKNDKAIRTIIIFSHRTKTATYVWKMLKENNIDADLLVKDTKQRELIVENFLNKRERRILVATDIASRGWDTQHVNHVINYEMPHFIADYIHRCGRVGRIGCHKSNGSGPKVTSFITRAFEVDMVMNIEKSVRLDSELNNVNSNIAEAFKDFNLKKYNNNDYFKIEL